MKIKLFKKEKKVSLENLHEREASPYMDWLKIIFVFSAIIIVSIIFSSLSFYYLISGSEFRQDDSGMNSPASDVPSINIYKLQSAVDFINSRAVNLPATTTSTTTPKK